MPDYYSDSRSRSLRDLFRLGGSQMTHKSRRRAKKHSNQEYQAPYSTKYQSDTRTSAKLRSYECYTEPPRKAHIKELPPEIQLSIFDNLDPASSACLGLASKQLYPMHRSRHKSVSLFEGKYQPLCMLLQDWAPSGLYLDWESEKMVSGEQYNMLEAARSRTGGYHPGSLYNPLQGDSNSRRSVVKRRKHFDNVYETSYYPAYIRPVQPPTSYYDTYQPDHVQPRLKKRQAMGRHDIWSNGSRVKIPGTCRNGVTA
ncbi:hypothetical protein BP6252_00525 [Coleophoma cylindrospora]|uniref:F-box domain-containing protein n=1 Tax=Coleophoma cylindrospora TaxID=1849047 RepID=A0A3D8SQ96_9HELO|nr:hypothetical protein BP6252_00525 [Coleophoma cylindrospora]